MSATDTSIHTTMDSVRSSVQRTVGGTRFRRYFNDGRSLGLEDGVLTVRVASPFYADWLGKKFGDALSLAAAEASGRSPVEVRWIVDERISPAGEDRAASRPPAPVPAKAPRPARARSRRGSGTATPLRGRLETMVVGEANRLAHEAGARLCAPDDSGGAPAFRMLVVHGCCGVGKTHLLQGIARRFGEVQPGARIRYATGESFTNEYVESVRSGRIGAFRSRIRSLDLLCIDDVHFIAGKKATQSEVLHTLDALELSGARVALATDAHPRLVEDLNDAIVSRCLSGLTVRIDLPDRAMRLELIRAMGARMAMRLRSDAVECIEQLSGASARDILGSLARIDARRLVTREHPDAVVDEACVRGVLRDETAPRRPVRMDELIDAACTELVVDRADVLGRSRHRRLVVARSLVAHLARECTSHSFPEIARALGRPNHSTVVTACQRVRRQIDAGEPCACGPAFEGVTIAALADRVRASALLRQRA